MMQVTVRPGDPADVPAVLALIKELAVYERQPDAVVVTAKEMLEWGFGATRAFGFFVLEKGKEIIGAAVYYFKYSTWKGRSMFLEDIIVTEAQRGNGYGTLLFRAVVDAAKHEQVRQLEWQVLEWNASAIRFYSKWNATFDHEWVNCKLTGEQLQSL